MSERLTLQHILPLLQGIQRLSNGEYLACCPVHDDAKPSLSLRETPDGKLLVHCHAGCSQEAVLQELRRLAGLDAPRHPTQAQVGLTLQQYADAKRLDTNLLQQWHVYNDIYGHKDAVKIEYRDVNGNLIAIQYRLALTGDRFRWKAGDSPKLYGLWRLPEYSECLWVVEGTSDCHTLWSAGIPAIAFPSASAKELISDFWRIAESFHYVYLCFDADGAGNTLRQAVLNACPEALQERAYVVRLPDGVKDISALWLQVEGNPEQLRSTLESVPKTPVQELREDNPFGEIADLGTGIKGKMDAYLRALEALWQGKYRYCVEWKAWLRWNGRYWETVPDVEKILNDARDTLLTCYAGQLAQAQDKKEREWYYKLIEELHKSTRALKNALELLQGREGYRTFACELDANPELLNTPAGIVNLRTVDIIAHDPAYLMTRITRATPERIDTPQWSQFLQRIFAGNDTLIRFVQKALGIALLGENREQRMYILWGAGANGKSTLVNTLLYALGNYARAIPRDAIMRDNKAQDAKRISYSALEGVRFGVLEELEEGAILSAVAIKTLTSNNPIDVRGLYERNRQVRLGITPFVCTNIKPHLTEFTDAVWRRLILIPFTVVIPEQERDPDLLNKLKVEADGILWWLLEGLKAYWQEGLQPPAEVLAATREYRTSEDALAEFLDACCEFNSQYKVSSSELYQAYTDWDTEDTPLTKEEFARILKARGYTKHKVGGRMYWKGLRLKKLPTIKPPKPTETETTEAEMGRVGEGFREFPLTPNENPPNRTQVFNGNPQKTLPNPPHSAPHLASDCRSEATEAETELADLLTLRPELAHLLAPICKWAKHYHYPKLQYSTFESVAQGKEYWMQFLKTAPVGTLEIVYNTITGGK